MTGPPGRASWPVLNAVRRRLLPKRTVGCRVDSGLSRLRSGYLPDLGERGASGGPITDYTGSGRKLQPGSSRLLEDLPHDSLLTGREGGEKVF